MCNEHDVYKVIGHIPGLNFWYSGIRAAVYAGQGNVLEAKRSGIGMIPFAHSTREAAPVVGDAILSNGKAYAVEFIKKSGKDVVAAIVAFCAANPWLVGTAVVVVIVAVVVFVMWRKARNKAQEETQTENIRNAVETALKSFGGGRGVIMMSRESLNAMIDEHIKAERTREEPCYLIAA